MHFARQLLEKPQHLRLRRDVKAGDDLVGEHEIRPEATARAMPTRWRWPPESSNE